MRYQLCNADVTHSAYGLVFVALKCLPVKMVAIYDSELPCIRTLKVKDFGAFSGHIFNTEIFQCEVTLEQQVLIRNTFNYGRLFTLGVIPFEGRWRWHGFSDFLLCMCKAILQRYGNKSIMHVINSINTK